MQWLTGCYDILPCGKGIHCGHVEIDGLLLRIASRSLAYGVCVDRKAIIEIAGLRWSSKVKLNACCVF